VGQEKIKVWWIRRRNSREVLSPSGGSIKDISGNSFSRRTPECYKTVDGLTERQRMMMFHSLMYAIGMSREYFY
jgi:hypothetical protein